MENYRIWAKLPDETTMTEWKTMLTEAFFEASKNSDWKNSVFLSADVGFENKIFHAEICSDEKFLEFGDFIVAFERELAKRTNGLLACGGKYAIPRKRKRTGWCCTFCCVLLIAALMVMIAAPIGMYLKYAEISQSRTEKIVEMKIRTYDEMGN